MIKKLAIILGLIAYSFAADAKAPRPALVNTAKVIKGEVNPLEEFIGSLNFSKTSALASQTNGIVNKVTFQAGDKIKKGTLLVQVDSRVLDSQIKALNANIKIAKINLDNETKNYKRYNKLLKNNSISQKIYDDSFLKYNLAKQNYYLSKVKLEEQKINKKNKSIRAPYDCLVIEKNIEISEWASAGKTIATVVSTAEVDLMFNLPTSYVYKLNKTDEYEINLNGTKIKSKLYANIAKGDKRTRTFPVKFKAKVNSSFLYEGMEVKINLPRNKKQNSLMVPRDAVIKRFGQNVIFLNIDGKANMMPVQIVGYTKENVAIVAKGLKEGSDVVVKGNERIFPKQALQSLNK